MHAPLVGLCCSSISHPFEIQGFEFEVIDQVLQPGVQLEQLLLEFHFGGLNNSATELWNLNDGGPKLWVDTVTKLYRAGFKLFHRYHNTSVGWC